MMYGVSIALQVLCRCSETEHLRYETEEKTA